MKNLVITGGLGFIGKNFYKNIKDKWDKIIILDKNTYAADYEYFLSIKRECDDVFLGDVTDSDFLEKHINKFDHVIHFAAESHVDKSFKSSTVFSLTNTYGTHLLLDICRFKEVEKIIVISTDEVYGESNLYCDEGAPMRPSNPYSATKSGADLISQSYYKSFKMPVVIVRPNNVYGERQNAEKIIPATIRAVNGGKKINIHGNGLTSRFFLHVDDLSSALDLILKKSKGGDILNIKGSTKIRIIDLISYAAKYKNIEVESISNFIEDRPFNDLLYSVDGSKIINLGWKEEKDFFSTFEGLIDDNSFIE